MLRSWTVQSQLSRGQCQWKKTRLSRDLEMMVHNVWKEDEFRLRRGYTIPPSKTFFSQGQSVTSELEPRKSKTITFMAKSSKAPIAWWKQPGILIFKPLWSIKSSVRQHFPLNLHQKRPSGHWMQLLVLEWTWLKCLLAAEGKCHLSLAVVCVPQARRSSKRSSRLIVLLMKTSKQLLWWGQKCFQLLERRRRVKRPNFSQIWRTKKSTGKIVGWS